MATKKAIKKKDTQQRIATFRKQAEPIIKRISDDRDELRGLLNEIEDVVASADDALDGFQYGLDRLSEYL